MKKFYISLLATTCLAFICDVNAQTVVSSLTDLKLRLEDPETANIIFDATGIENLADYYLEIGVGKNLTMQNIDSWKVAEQTNKNNEKRLIYNQGTLSLKNIDISNNKLVSSGGVSKSGAVILNKGSIDEISDFVFDNNYINGVAATYGGLIYNYSKSKIEKIANGKFSNNELYTSVKGAPHGAVIFNNDAYIGLIDNVIFENNKMSSGKDFSGGAHGTVIDNNSGGVIGKISNSKFINNAVYRIGDKYDSSVHASGGAIDNYGIIYEISDSYFEKNYASVQGNNLPVSGGAIFVAYLGNSDPGYIEKMNRLTFLENYVYSKKGMAIGGAFRMGGVAPKVDFIGNSTFQGNYAESETGLAMGGAIHSTGQINQISNTIFDQNYALSKSDIAAGGAFYMSSSGGEVFTKDIQATFTKNYTQSEINAIGGAVYVGVDTSLKGYLTASFNQNYAVGEGDAAVALGGAIYNTGTIENITGSEFLGNFVSANGQAQGGAIYNIGTISFSGTNIFKNNKAGSSYNDIHNDGHITFAGDITLDGGITGGGDISFKNGASLTMQLDKTTIEANTVTFEGKNNLNIIFDESVEDKEYDFITTQQESGLIGLQNVSIQDNLFYSLSLTQNGKISALKKTNEDIKNTLTQKMNEKNADMALALISLKEEGTKKAQEFALKINESLQSGSYKTVNDSLNDLSPTNSSVATQLSLTLNTLLTGITSSRVDTKGRSGGDVFSNNALWVKALYNHAKESSSSSSEGFSGNTKGLVFGLDGKINDTLTLGVGYAYSQTDADAGRKNIEIDGNTLFLYGTYQPNRWRADWLFSYGKNSYTEEKMPLNMPLRAKYDVDAYMMNLMMGYEFDFGFTPQTGLRYLIVDQEDYFDGIQYVKSDSNDILTMVAGGSYNKDFKRKDFVLKSMVKAYATYDLNDTDNRTYVQFSEGSNYKINSEGLARFGVETGAKLSLFMGDVEMSLEYDGRFKKDYQDHTGSINLKYNF